MKYRELGKGGDRMIKKRYLMILSLAIVSVLGGSLLYTSITFSKEEEKPTPVDVVNLPVDEEGNLKVKLVDNELWQAIIDLHSEINSLNATLTSRIEDLEGQITLLQTEIDTLQIQIDSLNASYLDLLDRVELLENMPLPRGLVSTPAYDSGWRNMPEGHHIILTHNLNTTDLFVYIIGRSEHDGINQMAYGGFSPWGDGIFWYELTETTIRIYREGGDESYEQIRAILWIIQEPPYTGILDVHETMSIPDEIGLYTQPIDGVEVSHIDWTITSGETESVTYYLRNKSLPATTVWMSWTTSGTLPSYLHLSMNWNGPEPWLENAKRDWNPWDTVSLSFILTADPDAPEGSISFNQMFEVHSSP